MRAQPLAPPLGSGQVSSNDGKFTVIEAAPRTPEQLHLQDIHVVQHGECRRVNDS